jgi:hypothetical protein
MGWATFLCDFFQKSHQVTLGDIGGKKYVFECYRWKLQLKKNYEILPTCPSYEKILSAYKNKIKDSKSIFTSMIMLLRESPLKSVLKQYTYICTYIHT